MSGYPFTEEGIRMCEYSDHSLEALVAIGWVRNLEQEAQFMPRGSCNVPSIVASVATYLAV